MNIEKLLKPNKICIVGASEKEGFGGDTCKNAIKYMSQDEYIFVNPKRSEIFGKKAYSSIEDIPCQFDLVVICTPISTVENILRQAHKHGASAAVIYASGYKETGTSEGIAAQESLKLLAKELDMAVMGPNCAGFVNFAHDKYVFAFISDDRQRKGSVGFVSQSGQLCLSMMENPSSFFSYSISAGNAVITTMEDYIEYLVDDNDTKVVAIYLEGLNNPQKFVNSLRKAAKIRKPVVVLKAGKSEKGGRVAASHTGSLAGSDKIFDALFSKFGVIRVDDLEELIYTAQLFATVKTIPHGERVASMNLSGGETGICADVGSLCGIDYPDFDDNTVEKLNELLPSYASVANPLDMTATLSYDTEKYAQVLRTVMADNNIDIVMIGYTLLQEIADPAIHYMAAAIEIVSKEDNSKPMVMLPFAGNTRNFEYQQRLANCGVCVLPAPIYGLRILKHLCNFAVYDYTMYDDRLAIPDRPRGENRISLSEYDAKQLLKKYGVAVPNSAVATSAENAVELANKVGYPVVLKIASTEIQHKSDCGGVVLDVMNDEQLIKTYAQIMTNVKKHHPTANIDGMLVQHEADYGREIIVGINSDAQLGPAILVGLGGIFVEVFKDTALALAPVSKLEAVNMLKSLKSYKLLTGYRKTPPCDIDALADLIVLVSQFALTNKNKLIELDLNPVFIYEKGVCAVDAVVVSDETIS